MASTMQKSNDCVFLDNCELPSQPAGSPTSRTCRPTVARALGPLPTPTHLHCQAILTARVSYPAIPVLRPTARALGPPVRCSALSFYTRLSSGEDLQMSRREIALSRSVSGCPMPQKAHLRSPSGPASQPGLARVPQIFTNSRCRTSTRM